MGAQRVEFAGSSSASLYKDACVGCQAHLLLRRMALVVPSTLVQIPGRLTKPRRPDPLDAVRTDACNFAGELGWDGWCAASWDVKCPLGLFLSMYCFHAGSASVAGLSCAVLLRIRENPCLTRSFGARVLSGVPVTASSQISAARIAAVACSVSAVLITM